VFSGSSVLSEKLGLSTLTSVSNYKWQHQGGSVTSAMRLSSVEAESSVP
jgi:hypothetical protein